MTPWSTFSMSEVRRSRGSRCRCGQFVVFVRNDNGAISPPLDPPESGGWAVHECGAQGVLEGSPQDQAHYARVRPSRSTAACDRCGRVFLAERLREHEESCVWGSVRAALARLRALTAF